MPHKYRNDLTAEYVRARLDYDPLTGIFTWRHHPDIHYNCLYLIGQIAGGVGSDGRNQIKIKGKPYLAARLAWLHVHGTWPENEVDHRDLNKLNDRINNLRDATHEQNSRNQKLRRNNVSGFKGIFPHGNKWIAKIGVENKQVYLGLSPTKEAAATQYAIAAGQYHGEFARTE